MPTRPGYIWSGTEWVSIGQEAVVAPVSYQTSAPSTPSTGDIWIDSNDDVPGIDTSQFLRWRKTAAGGETSVSGTDDNGLTLQYTANYEQVYLNGVLLVRGQDYTATNGTSITGLTALAANDVVEVFGVVARVVGDTYTQAQTNSLLDAKSNVSSTGLVLVSSNTLSAAANITINNCFTSSYINYRITFEGTGSTAGGLYARLTSNGTPVATGYQLGVVYVTNAGGPTRSYSGSATEFYLSRIPDITMGGSWDIYSPQLAKNTNLTGMYASWSATASELGSVYELLYNSNSYDGIYIYPQSGTITGTIKVYGYK